MSVAVLRGAGRYLNPGLCSYLRLKTLHTSSVKVLSGGTKPNFKVLSELNNSHFRKFFCSNTDLSLQTSECAEEDELYRQITVEVKGHDPAVISSYEQFVKMAANELEITVSNSFTPPKVITRYTLLKSVHVHRKHRVQYEQRTHYKVIELKFLTGSTADTFLEYIQRNLPEGMAMKVSRHRLEVIPEHMKAPKEDGKDFEWTVDPILGPVMTNLEKS